MLEGRNYSRLIFILILVLATAGVIFIVVSKTKSPAASPTVSSAPQNYQAASGNAYIGSNSEPAPAISAEELEASYQQTAKTVVQSFLSKGQTAPLNQTLSSDQKSDWSKFVENAKNQLLALRVPGQYRDLHLQLVLDFQSLVDGLSKNSDLALATKKIDGLVAQYPWLVN